MVAAKLGVSDVPQWIERELSGYYGIDEVPAYRLVRGTAKAKIMHSYIDLQFADNNMEKMISERRIDGSVADLEALLSTPKGSLSIMYPAETQQTLRDLFEQPRAQFVCIIERARLASILDRIRNEVLRWAIALDAAGVRGDGLSFSPAEKEKANNVVVQHAGTITIGNIGNVADHSNVAAGYRPRAGSITGEDLRSLVSEIQSHVRSLGLPPSDENHLNSALVDLEDAAKPEPVESTKVRQGLTRVLTFVGKASQSVISAGTKALIEQWMRAHGIGP